MLLNLNALLATDCSIYGRVADSEESQRVSEELVGDVAQMFHLTYNDLHLTFAHLSM